MNLFRTGILWGDGELGQWHHNQSETQAGKWKWNPSTCPLLQVNQHDHTQTIVTLMILGVNTVIHFLLCRGQHSCGDTLQSCGISQGSTLHFSLSTFPDDTPHNETFFIHDVVPSVQQTQKGISVFLSSLYALVSFISLYTYCALFWPLHFIICIPLCNIVQRLNTQSAPFITRTWKATNI